MFVFTWLVLSTWHLAYNFKPFLSSCCTIRLSSEWGNQSRTNCVQYLFNTQVHTSGCSFPVLWTTVFSFQNISNQLLPFSFQYLFYSHFHLKSVRMFFPQLCESYPSGTFYFSSDWHEPTVCCISSSLNATKNECSASFDADNWWELEGREPFTPMLVPLYLRHFGLFKSLFQTFHYLFNQILWIAEIQITNTTTEPFLPLCESWKRKQTEFLYRMERGSEGGVWIPRFLWSGGKHDNLKSCSHEWYRITMRTFSVNSFL